MLEIIAYIYFTMGALTALLLVVKLLSILLKRQKDHELSSHTPHAHTNVPSFHVVIPAWNEGHVILSTIEKIKTAREKPGIPVKIWIATYPNDYSTLHALRGSPGDEGDVSTIMNPLEGPTTKSQNLAHALSTLVENIKQYRSEGDLYVLVLDAEVYPTKDYFEVLKNLLKYDPKTIYQTKVIAYPFTCRSLKEKIVGQMYFVAQSYMQWFIDKPRGELGRNIMLKGAGMILPQDSITDVVRALRQANKQGFVSRYLRLADDLLISIELSKLGYKIKYVDSTYTLEEPPKRLKVAIKRYVRWFKANMAVLWCYGGALLRHYLHNLVAKIAIALSPIVYIGLIASLLLYERIHQPILIFNIVMSIYYLFIPSLVATVYELNIPEIVKSMGDGVKGLLKEFSINLVSNALNHLITPLVAIIGYLELLRGDVHWYKTERS